VPALNALVRSRHTVVGVLTQPDRPKGRGQQLAASPVKTAALAANIPVAQPETLKTEAGRQALTEWQPDVLVVVAYGLILPAAVLAIPRLGCVNIHASLLPRWRGAAPIQWSIIAGDAETGVSIMRMEAGLDTGPVAARARAAIHDDDTTASLGERLSLLGAELLAATLPRIAEGGVALEAQDDALMTLAPPLAKEDGRLDFAQPARVVGARARGVDPWPGATALLDGQPVKLFGARVVAAVGAAAPGTVARIDADGMVVACGDGGGGDAGAIAFADVQLPGRKRLPAVVAASGRAISVGARFG